MENENIPDISGILKKLKYPILIVIALVILLVINPFSTISAGNTGVKLNFGKLDPQPLLPGLHVVIPFYQTVSTVPANPVTVRTQEEAATHDLQNVSTQVSVTFHIIPENAPEFYSNFRTVENITNRIIGPSISNDVKAVTAKYNAEELITKRDLVDSEIKDLVSKSLRPYNISIEAVNTANFKFSERYSDAIEKKQVAQQESLQAEYTLQQKRISAQTEVVEAKAHADAAVEAANGKAQSLLITSKAEAESNNTLSKSITPILLSQRALERWDGTMPVYLSSGAPLPFIGSAAQAPKPVPESKP